MIVGFIDEYRSQHGVEPICRVLSGHGIKIAPSTYYAFKTRPASARARSDAGLVRVIASVHQANYGVYGARRVWHELHRQGHTDVARCTVERLMRANGLRGISKAKTPRTTIPASSPMPTDKVQRQFTAEAPDRLWVADITYIRTFDGCAAFILDMCSRMIVGWQLSTSLHTRLAFDALDMALWRRAREQRDLSALIHHSDKGVQYRAIRYTQRLADAGVVASVGSTGDSYDNAAAEAFNSLFKAELIRNRGPWHGHSDLEFAVTEYIDWYNHRRLHSEIGYQPPAEYEATFYDQPQTSSTEFVTTTGSL
ncbi:putative transposase [Propioniciclava tarda]|nr:putative transposase [Propioniciclava tarda]